MSTAASTVGEQSQEMLTVALLGPDRREPPAPAAALAPDRGFVDPGLAS